MSENTSRSDGDYRKLSNRAFVAIFACSLVLWLFFVYRGEDVRGFLAALSAGAVGGVAAILGRYRDRQAYWVALAFIGLAHAVAVLFIHWPEEWHGPGIVFSPLVIVDMYVSAKLVIFVLTRSGH